jgi:hypothetical protein
MVPVMTRGVVTELDTVGIEYVVRIAEDFHLDADEHLRIAVRGMLDLVRGVVLAADGVEDPACRWLQYVLDGGQVNDLDDLVADRRRDIEFDTGVVWVVTENALARQADGFLGQVVTDGIFGSHHPKAAAVSE